MAAFKRRDMLKISRITCGLLLAAMLAGPAGAAGEEIMGSPKWWLKDAGTAAAAPFKWDTSDLKSIGIFTAAAGVSFLWFDDNLEDYSEKVKHNDFNVLSEKVRYLGDGLVVVPLFGAAYAYGAAGGGTKLQSAALVGLESYVVSGAFATLVKFSVHRPRPKTGGSYQSSGNQNFFSTRNLSFPSGHSTSAFSSARVISWYFGDRGAAPYISYGIASLVAWSRVNDREHWASDVVVGSMLGYFTADKIISLNEARRANTLSLLPFYGDAPGLTASLRF